MTQFDKERRQARARVDCAGRVTIDYVEHDCVIANLSWGGALVAAEGLRPEIESFVLVDLALPELEQRMLAQAGVGDARLPGWVRWCGERGFGVQFGGLGPDEIVALDQLITSGGWSPA